MPAIQYTHNQCDNCGSIWPDEELNDVRDYFERVKAGEIAPSGECPRCGNLCYPVTLRPSQIEQKWKPPIGTKTRKTTWKYRFPKWKTNKWTQLNLDSPMTKDEVIKAIQENVRTHSVPIVR